MPFADIEDDLAGSELARRTAGEPLRRLDLSCIELRIKLVAACLD
jgi:hypothetical protein